MKKKNGEETIDGPAKSPSKRKFENRNCVNKNCIYFPVFPPSRKNQQYCCEQCQIDSANDRAQEANRTKYREEKFLRQYDKKLQKLYEFFLKDGHCSVHVEFLRYEKIDLTKLVHEQTNENTKQKVKWFYEYGTERHPEDKDWFFIKYRIKTK